MSVPEGALYALARSAVALLDEEGTNVYDDTHRQWHVAYEDGCGPDELLLVRAIQDGVAERVRLRVEFKEVRRSE